MTVKATSLELWHFAMTRLWIAAILFVIGAIICMVNDYAWFALFGVVMAVFCVVGAIYAMDRCNLMLEGEDDEQ